MFSTNGLTSCQLHLFVTTINALLHASLAKNVPRTIPEYTGIESDYSKINLVEKQQTSVFQVEGKTATVA